MEEALASEIESVRKLKTKALRARYEELFGEEARSSNHAHLFRRVAWRLQANAEGDLSERARKRALELAEDAALRLRAPRSFWHADGSVGVWSGNSRAVNIRLPIDSSNSTCHRAVRGGKWILRFANLSWEQSVVVST